MNWNKSRTCCWFGCCRRCCWARWFSWPGPRWLRGQGQIPAVVDPADAVLHRVPTVAVASGCWSHYRPVATDSDVSGDLRSFCNRNEFILVSEAKTAGWGSIVGADERQILFTGHSLVSFHALQVTKVLPWVLATRIGHDRKELSL